jgi:hypothetical protein
MLVFRVDGLLRGGELLYDRLTDSVGVGIGGKALRMVKPWLVPIGGTTKHTVAVGHLRLVGFKISEIYLYIYTI